MLKMLMSLYFYPWYVSNYWCLINNFAGPQPKLTDEICVTLPRDFLEGLPIIGCSKQFENKKVEVFEGSPSIGT